MIHSNMTLMGNGSDNVEESVCGGETVGNYLAGSIADMNSSLNEQLLNRINGIH